MQNSSCASQLVNAIRCFDAAAVESIGVALRHGAGMSFSMILRDPSPAHRFGINYARMLLRCVLCVSDRNCETLRQIGDGCKADGCCRGRTRRTSWIRTRRRRRWTCRSNSRCRRPALAPAAAATATAAQRQRRQLGQTRQGQRRQRHRPGGACASTSQVRDARSSTLEVMRERRQVDMH